MCKHVSGRGDHRQTQLLNKLFTFPYSMPTHMHNGRVGNARGAGRLVNGLQLGMAVRNVKLHGLAIPQGVGAKVKDGDYQLFALAIDHMPVAEAVRHERLVPKVARTLFLEEGLVSKVNQDLGLASKRRRSVVDIWDGAQPLCGGVNVEQMQVGVDGDEGIAVGARLGLLHDAGKLASSEA